MSRKLLISDAIDAVAEAILAKKECDLVHQEFDHARILISEAVQNRNDMIEFLLALRDLKASDDLPEKAKSRILKQVAIMLRDQLHFNKGCEAILDRFDI